MQRSFLRLATLSLFLALTFVGCDSNDESDDGPNLPGTTVGGTSSVDISVDGPADFSGNAYAILANDGSFGLLLYDGAYDANVFAGTEAFVLLARDSDDGLPSSGTFEINDGDDETDFFGGYIDADAANPLAGTVVTAESGTLTITGVNSDEVEGRFTFTGTLVRNGAPTPNVTVSGSFEAIVLEEADFPDDV